MIKIIPVGSWSGLSQDGVCVRQLPVLHHGRLGAEDGRLFLKASTSTEEFLKKFAETRLHPGEIPLHVIALGSTEAWGSNRNGDGFTEETCRKHHDGFTKFARLYLNHKNRDPARSYGLVKLSYYNEPMRRVELLIVANGTKEAANQNHGLVLPDKIRESLDRQDDRAVSMSCRIPYDRCINCEKQARSRADYCDASDCLNPRTGRRGFGCRSGLCKAAEDGFLQYVDNPNPTWFDISDVTPNPADPIAWGGKVPGHLFKSAEQSGSLMGGAELAEIYAPSNDPQFLLGGFDLTGAGAELQAQQAWGTKLAAAMTGEGETADKELPFHSSVFAAEPVDWRQALGTAGSDRARAGLRKLADCRLAFSLPEFSRWRGFDPRFCKTAAQLLCEPEAWRLISDSLENLASNPYWDRQQQPGACPVISPLAVFSRSLTKEAVVERIKVAACYSELEERREPMLEEHPQAVQLAQEFGWYKLAWLSMTGIRPGSDPDSQRLLLLTTSQISAERY